MNKEALLDFLGTHVLPTAILLGVTGGVLLFAMLATLKTAGASASWSDVISRSIATTLVCIVVYLVGAAATRRAMRR